VVIFELFSCEFSKTGHGWMRGVAPGGVAAHGVAERSVALQGYTGWLSARTHGCHSVTVWRG